MRKLAITLAVLALLTAAAANANKLSKLANNFQIAGNLAVTGTTTQTGVATFTGIPVFPSGGIQLKDSGGDHVTTLKQNSDEAANRTLNIPALGGNDTLMTLAVAQTVTAIKTMTGANVITHAPTGLKVQDSDASHAITIAPGNESADRTLNLPVLGGNDTAMTLATAQAVTGEKTLQGGGAATATYVASGVLNRALTQVATGANTTETDGHTYTLPANTLNANGRGVRVSAWGTTAGNGNNKTFQFYFGGTSVYTTGAVAANAKNFKVNMTIYREGAGDQRIYIDGHFNGTPIVASTVVNGAKDETTTLVIKDTITNGTASAADITVEGFEVQFL